MPKPDDNLPVVIVGAGPVGLLLAIDLARQGVRSVVVDSKDSVQWTSRASCISRRSQEILRRVGVVPDFFEKAIGWHKGRTFHGSKQVFELRMPFDPRRDAHAPMVNLQQFYTEQFLLDTALGLGDRIDIRWATRFAGFSQDADGVTVHLHDLASNRIDDLRGAFLVGCDGARSAVRAALGLRLKGRTYEGRYLIADVRVQDPARQPVERWVWFNPESNRGSTTILHVQPDDVWRIDVQVDSTIPDETLLARDHVKDVVQRHFDMMGQEGPWDLVWHSVYRANALSLDDYRHGRVLLAGDAAHLVPIFGVRGMNSGLDDAHNLAWKLASLLRGSGTQALLDSFSLERRRACLENLANAVRSTWFMSPPSEGFRLMRDGALLLAEQAEWARALINPRQSTAHVYTASPLTADQARQGLQPGAVLPDLPVTQGGSLQRRLAPVGAFTLLIDARQPDAAWLGALGDAPWPAETGLVLLGDGQGVSLDGADMDLLFAGAGLILVVRPDEHIVGWAQDAAGAAGLIDLALGHAPSRAKADFIAVDRADDLVPPSALEAMFERLALAVDAGTLEVATPQEAAGALTASHAALIA
jgi:3-(3-hydroxy-phenyl)propionate hydroxylase